MQFALKVHHVFKLNKMATLNIPQNNKALKGSTLKKLPSVDLTAMVDLAFLLITFFMLTTSLAKMKAIDIAKPVPIEDITNLQAYPASRTMTILLGENNQVVYYMGETEYANMQLSNVTSIKEHIISNKLMVAKTHNNLKDQQLIVIIKPTKTSTYKNFVDIIDEMSITAVQSYAIDDKYISERERNFMFAKGI